MGSYWAKPIKDGQFYPTDTRELELNYRNLESFPKEIFSLCKLEKLNMNRNLIRDIPQNITRLKLTSLDMSYNYLTSIPEYLSKVSTLVELNLSNNSIFTIPEYISNLVNLTNLDISNNQIRDSGISALHLLTSLTSLKSLNLSMNGISNFSPSISQLINLTNLDLSGNYITDVPDSISCLLNLTRLNLCNNSISSIPNSISRLDSLEYLNLSINNISDISESMVKLHSLRELYLGSNIISSIPNSISELINLRKLVLSGNYILEIPYSISKLEHLTNLCVSSNRISVIPHFISTMRNLRDFIYFHNPIQYIAPSVVRMITKQPQNIYSDCVNHDHYLTDSFKKSINELMSKVDNINEDFLSDIRSDVVLTQECCDNIINFAISNKTYSQLNITFLELLRAVWNRIKINKNKDEIKRVLNKNFSYSKGMCSMSYLVNLVNSLKGFDDLILDDHREALDAICIVSKLYLDKNQTYTRELHIYKIRQMMQELDYSQSVIDDYISGISNMYI